MATPANAALIITGIEALVTYLLQLKANGQLSDDQLDALVAGTNAETRALIQNALGAAREETPQPKDPPTV